MIYYDIFTQSAEPKNNKKTLLSDKVQLCQMKLQCITTDQTIWDTPTFAIEGQRNAAPMQMAVNHRMDRITIQHLGEYSIAVPIIDRWIVQQNHDRLFCVSSQPHGALQ